MFRKITSLIMTFSFIAMTLTGISLFLAPPGRVANWGEWSLFGLSKEQHGDVHVTFMVLFIIFGILHIYFNFRPLINYLKNSSKELVVLTKEFIVSILISALFLAGAIYGFFPFSNFLELRSDIQEYWEESIERSPYSHAELSPLDQLCKKTGLQITKALSTLEENGIKADPKSTLKDLAKEYKTSPAKLYELIQKGEE